MPNTVARGFVRKAESDSDAIFNFGPIIFVAKKKYII